MASNRIYQKPSTRKIATPAGRAADINRAAKVHQKAPYSPQPFPKRT